MFLNELFEAYDYDGGEKYSGIDRDLYDWIRNEIALHWSPEKQEKVKQIYGNVPVGTIYRGMKINSEELLHKLENWKSVGTIHANLVSATPDYETAKSFALYVKSYDESTLFYHLKKSLSNGSAGQFGTAVVSLAPTPSQVIVKTYKNGNERSDWARPPYSLESEVIISGDIKIVDVKIYYPLKKETWVENLSSQITSITDIDNDFFCRWLEKYIDKNDINTFFEKHLPTIIHNDDDIYKLLKMSSLPFQRDILYNIPIIQKFFKKHFNNGWVVYNNNKIYIPSVIARQYANKSSLKSSFNDLINTISIQDIKKDSDNVANLVQMVNIHPGLVSQFKNSEIIKYIQNTIEQKFNHLLSINETNYKSKYESKYDLDHDFSNLISYAEYYKNFHPKMKDMVGKMIKHILHDFVKRGTISPDKQESLDALRRIIETHVPRLMELYRQ